MTERLSDEELAAIRTRVKAASPGPWEAQEAFGGTFGRVRNDFGSLLGKTPRIFDGGGNPTIRRVEDAEFMAHARTDVPKLLDEIAALKAELAEERESFSKVVKGVGRALSIH